MANIWTVRSGHNLGVISERSVTELQLPIDLTNTDTYSYSVISGSLPPGLRLAGSKLVGTPYEVARLTEFKFVIRAAKTGTVSDRTFILSIEGPDTPSWITPEGLLPVGNNNTYYILDTSYIDFTLEAVDFDTAAGQKLTFTKLEQDGELPPGLILTPEGRITGYVQPLLAIPKDIDNGNFDTSLFDAVAYDFGFRSSNGFDRWTFDWATYDLSTKALLPTKLNRNYQFTVTLSDGDNYERRTFRIS